MQQHKLTYIRRVVYDVLVFWLFVFSAIFFLLTFGFSMALWGFLFIFIFSERHMHKHTRIGFMVRQ